MRVLIAEDDPVVALGLAERVRSLGHEPIGPACDGEQALELARESLPDLYLFEYRQCIGPAARVVIPTHGNHGSQGTQGFKHLRRSDIPGMNDQVGFAERPDRFRPQEAVRV